MSNTPKKSKKSKGNSSKPKSHKPSSAPDYPPPPSRDQTIQYKRGEIIAAKAADHLSSYIQPNSEYFGKIVYRELEWKIPLFSPFQHYSVMISAEYVISWVPQSMNLINSNGEMVVHPVDWKQDRFDSKFKQFDRVATYQRILASPKIFKDVHYDFLKFNCEHVARLLSYGYAESFQVKRKLFGFSKSTTAKFDSEMILAVTDSTDL